MSELTFETLNKAWWDWVDINCSSKSKRTRGRWMHSNVFEFDGTVWKRNWGAMTSNSGKTKTTTSEVFVGADGRTIGYQLDIPLNRRNDPNRNWGLPE